MRGIGYGYPRLLNLGMTAEIGTDQLFVPGPLILGIGGGMDAHKPLPRADILLKDRLLLRVEHILGGAEENHGLIRFQPFCGKYIRFIGGVHANVVFPAQFLQGGYARRDRLVVIPAGFMKDQDTGLPRVYALFGPGVRRTTIDKEVHQQQEDLIAYHIVWYLTHTARRAQPIYYNVATILGGACPLQAIHNLHHGLERRAGTAGLVDCSGHIEVLLRHIKSKRTGRPRMTHHLGKRLKRR